MKRLKNIPRISRVLRPAFLLASALFTSCPQEYVLDSVTFEDALSCGLPLMHIDIERNAITSREEWITGVPYVLYDTNGEALVSGGTDIKGRGNSTWVLPKKSYAIKLTKKEPLLDMPSHKRWNLLANYYDKTRIRNELGFYLGGRLDNMAWQPRSQQVMVFLGDEFAGLYLLTEAIKIDSNRVAIEEISPENPDGGYILEINNLLKDEAFYIETTHGLWLSCADPDGGLNDPINDPIEGENRSILQKMQADVQAAEDVLYGASWLDSENGWRKYFDAPSFVDFYLAAEIVKDFEINILNGRYLYFDDESQKYCAGPLWDFDQSFGFASWWGADAVDGFMTIGNEIQEPNYGGSDYSWAAGERQQWWLDRMFEDPAFTAEVKARWNALYPGLNDALQAYIDERASALDAAVTLDNKIWDKSLAPINRLSFVILKNWLSARLEWLDGAINDL